MSQLMLVLVRMSWLFALSGIARTTVASITANVGNRSTFGFASDAIQLTTAPTTLMVQNSSNGGVISFMFIQSAELLWSAFDDVRVSIFVDDDVAPSVYFPLGWFDEGDLVPWGATLVGSTAYAGGLYLTVKIPFLSQARVTAQLGPSDSGTRVVRVVMRGVTGLAVTSFAGMSAAPPFVRAKLRTSFVDSVSYTPLQRVPLAASSAPGVLVALGLKAVSTNTSFVSGPVNASIDGAGVSLGYDLAGFLAADDTFATGKYVTPLGGVTAFADLVQNYIIAWRGFDLDPVTWSATMALDWSIGAPGAPPAGDTTVTSVVWWYEWSM